MSEEKGAVSIALGGKLTKDLPQDRFRLVLQKIFAQEEEKKEASILGRIFRR